MARALQGVFGALLTPAALAIIVATFPPAERGMAIGSWTAWSGIATVVGPLVGGQLVDSVSWRAIFAINVPFVLITLAMSTKIPAARVHRPDAHVDGVGGGARGARPGRPDVRPDPAAGARLGRPDGVAPRPRRPRPARRLRRLGAPPQGPDAAAGHVPRAQLQRRQRRDVRHVRRAGRRLLRARDLPAAGCGLQRARGGPGDDAFDDHHVPAVAALRRARRPLRAAHVHGLRAAGLGGRHPAVHARRRRRRLRRRRAAAA